MPYINADEKPDGLVITFMDITESKMLEIALRQARKDLEKRMDSKGIESVEGDGIANEKS
jgi:hypothetical protein